MNTLMTVVFSALALAATVLFLAETMPTELARRLLS